MKERPLLIGVAVSAVLGVLFVQLAGVYESAPAVLSFDAQLGGAIQSLRMPPLTAALRFVTLLGDTLAVTALTLAIMAVMWLREHKRRAWYVGVVGAIGAWLATGFKEVYDRSRPPAEGALIALPASFSFPSGHTMASLCLGWAIGYIALRSRRTPRVKALIIIGAILYVLLIAFSRVYLGAHWPSDVLASWLLGGSWLALATGVYEWNRIRLRAGT